MAVPLGGFEGVALMPEKGEAKRLIWLMHGSGGHASDITAVLAPGLRRAFADAAIYAPEGQVPARNGNRQHFELEKFYNKDLFIQPFNQLNLKQNFNRVAIALNAAAHGRETNAALDAVMKHHGLNESQTVMLGYSQGGACVLQAALTRAQPVRQAISIFGGWMGDERQIARAKPPVIMVAGKDDRVVPYEGMTATLHALNAAGVDARMIEIPHADHHKDWRMVAQNILPMIKF